MPFYKCTITHQGGEQVQQLEADTPEEAKNVVFADVSPRLGKDIEISVEEMKED